MQEIYQPVYLSMLELSNHPNLNLYILISAGISLSCFATAIVLAMKGKLLSTQNVRVSAQSDSEPIEAEHEFEYDRQFVNLETKVLEKV
ncbi:hypothetical protein TUMEXPCC7403_07480 [Tumidithrix helvetica PCC 7403]